jgi:hypothetical protein
MEKGRKYEKEVELIPKEFNKVHTEKSKRKHRSS